jgi:predicted transcriptional regulator of viral defense system
MKNKYISTQSNELLSYFNEQNRNCFDYSLAYKALPGSKSSAVRELLSDMTKRGLLMRLKEGVYYIIPYEQNAETYMPDWHLTAEYLVNDAKHYIGYYSALQIHNLITQPSLKEQIVVSKQIRPSEFKIKEVPFQFIYHNEKHFLAQKKPGLTVLIKCCVPTWKKHLLTVCLNLIMPAGLLKSQEHYTFQKTK